MPSTALLETRQSNNSPNDQLIKPCLELLNSPGEPPQVLQALLEKVNLFGFAPDKLIVVNHSNHPH